MARNKKQKEPVNRTGYPIVKIFGSQPTGEVIDAIKVYLNFLGLTNAYILEAPLASIRTIDPKQEKVSTLVMLPIYRNPSDFYPHTSMTPSSVIEALRQLHIALDNISNCNVLIEAYELKKEDISDPSDYR